jgi:hypothetical protein
LWGNFNIQRCRATYMSRFGVSLAKNRQVFITFQGDFSF